MNKPVGTCSICGGPVTIPDIWNGVVPPTPTCQRCGAVPREPHGPVIPMKRAQWWHDISNQELANSYEKLKSRSSRELKNVTMDDLTEAEELVRSIRERLRSMVIAMHRSHGPKKILGQLRYSGHLEIRLEDGDTAWDPATGDLSILGPARVIYNDTVSGVHCTVDRQPRRVRDSDELL